MNVPPHNGVPDRDYAIEWVPPETLKPDPKNARVHPKRQIEQLKASIKRFGYAHPIKTDEDGNVIAGHGGLEAAKQLGMHLVPRIVLTNLTALEKKALAIADNKIGLNSTWDLEIYKETVEILSLEFEPEELGMEVGEIDHLVSAAACDPDDEAIPAVSERLVTRSGDVWILGEHRIGCGDARDAAFVDRVLSGARVAAAFQDPPYNVPIAGHVGGKGQIQHREFAMGVGEMSPAAFIEFLVEVMAPAVRASRDGAVHFVCMDHHHAGELIAAGERLFGARLNICVWNKSNAGMGSLYRSKHELVFVFRVGQAPHRNNVELGRHGRNRTNVWDYASVNTFGGSRRHDLALHPTVKPVGLVADAIQDVTKRGEVVIDCFLGSGTTLIACERTGRVCRGIEIDPAYVDVALERHRLMTGRDAVLAETGEPICEVAKRRASQVEEA